MKTTTRVRYICDVDNAHGMCVSIVNNAFHVCGILNDNVHRVCIIVYLSHLPTTFAATSVIKSNLGFSLLIIDNAQGMCVIIIDNAQGMCVIIIDNALSTMWPISNGAIMHSVCVINNMDNLVTLFSPMCPPIAPPTFSLPSTFALCFD